MLDDAGVIEASAQGEARHSDASSDIEASARRLGWRPRDEYHGPLGEWLPADDFVARIEETISSLKRALRKLDDRVAAQERELTDLRQTLAEFREFSMRAIERAEGRGPGSRARPSRRGAS